MDPADPNSTGKSPAFQFYPTDFISDPNVVAMSLAERGAYITLLCMCWQAPLPSEQARLARLCKVSLAAFRRLWPALEPCFRVHSDDPSRLIQPRMERERLKQEKYRAMKAEAGRKGGRPKAEVKQNQSRRVSRTKAKESPPSSSSSSSSSSFSSSDSLLLAADAAGEASDPDLDTEHIPNTEVHAFLKRFCELYSQYRHGAKYLVKRQKDVPNVKLLLSTYDRGRLERLAQVLLTTDDDWVQGTDRGIGILTVKAAWLDGLLADYEAQHGKIGAA